MLHVIKYWLKIYLWEDFYKFLIAEQNVTKFYLEKAGSLIVINQGQINKEAVFLHSW